MSKVVNIIPIPRPVTRYVQALQYRIDGYESVFKFISGKVINPVAARLNKEVGMYFQEFNVLMEEIKSRYLINEYKTSDYEIRIRYADSYLEVLGPDSEEPLTWTVDRVRKTPMSFSDEFVEILANPTITDKLLNKDITIPEAKDKYDRRICGKSVTFNVTENCNLACTYCYQCTKTNKSMNRETAFKSVDLLFEEYAAGNHYLNKDNAKCIILDFIGGETLLEIDLIEATIEYFLIKAANLDHPWLIHHMVSITTNGVLYDTPRVREFAKKYQKRLSLTITIDGNKELHDSCRLFPDGTGSYDVVEKSIKAQMEDIEWVETKLTIAPENVSYLSGAIKHLFELGLDGVYANCVYEEGWEPKHATILFEQLVELADWMISSGAYTTNYTTIFEDSLGTAMDPEDDVNYCGGTGAMLSFGEDGTIYPCLRYQAFSLPEGVEPITLGNLSDGLIATEKDKATAIHLDSITRSTQSSEECFNCPIATGCGWCSAYNYQVNGDPNTRVTYVCEMHKARVLGNIYYWNKVDEHIRKNSGASDDETSKLTLMQNNVPIEWQEAIVPEKYNKILNSYRKESK